MNILKKLRNNFFSTPYPTKIDKPHIHDSDKFSLFISNITEQADLGTRVKLAAVNRTAYQERINLHKQFRLAIKKNDYAEAGRLLELDETLSNFTLTKVDIKAFVNVIIAGIPQEDLFSNMEPIQKEKCLLFMLIFYRQLKYFPETKLMAKVIAPYLLERKVQNIDGIKVSFEVVENILHLNSTILHLASFAAKPKLVLAILKTEEGKKFINTLNQNGHTPLFYALHNNKKGEEIVQILLSYGAKNQIRESGVNNTCNSPLEKVESIIKKNEQTDADVSSLNNIKQMIERKFPNELAV